jgi:2-dehydro-3-deoxyphosphogluconate aldolase/(4S)-4-hydroxy-2-oxoglutarate aldolase
LRTPVAMEALAMLKKELPDIVIGAGTVLTIEQMEQSIAAGADFLVTPGTPPEMADALAKAPIPVVPGGATPTEFLSLMARGFRVCKLFPANAVGGLAMLKGLAGPLAELKICPTGGITEDNAGEFLSQPNVVCIGGSWMVPKAWIEAGEWSKVTDSSAKAAAIVAKARG